VWRLTWAGDTTPSHATPVAEIYVRPGRGRSWYLETTNCVTTTTFSAGDAADVTFSETRSGSADPVFGVPSGPGVQRCGATGSRGTYSSYRLGGSGYADDSEHALAVQLYTGTCAVNGAPFAGGGPFGGYKASGFGRAARAEGPDRYLRLTSVALPANWRPTAVTRSMSSGTTTLQRSGRAPNISGPARRRPTRCGVRGSSRRPQADRPSRPTTSRCS
jgi:Aldehyde dehydrogenase family